MKGKTKHMFTYTVLLAYPYEDPIQTYLAHVTGDTTEEAIKEGRRKACDDNDGNYDPEDFEVLAVFYGYRSDLKGDLR